MLPATWVTGSSKVLNGTANPAASRACAGFEWGSGSLTHSTKLALAVQ